MVGNAHSFPDSVANEKSYNPLLDPLSKSAQLRRRLFRGETVAAAQIERELGGSTGLTHAVCALMEEWGFRFIRSENEDGRTWRLANPEHEPTGRNKKYPKTADGTPSLKARTAASAVIQERLLAGEAMTDAMGMEAGAKSDTYVRRLVARLAREGYGFEKSGKPPAYRLVRTPSGRANGTKTPKPKKEVVHVPHQDELPLDSPPAPAFLSTLTVFMLAEKDGAEGEYVIGLKNGSKRWLAEITGFVEQR